jgi:HPt (histidine-containing phosphotransfer) domain-containing protein
MTANAVEGDRERCIAVGMDDYLSKPVKRDGLRQMLQRWLPGGPPQAAPQARACPADSTSPVDLQTLLEAVGGDPEFFAEMVEAYRSSAAEALDDLDAAVRAGSPAEVARVAHKLLGGSTVCGMTAIVGPLRALEGRGNASDLAGAGALVDEAREAFERIQRFLDEHSALPI